MIELLIIADDLTGALDTGVKFSQAGIYTRVFTEYTCSIEVPKEPSVFVVNIDSRHTTPKEAYSRVYKLVSEMREKSVKRFYKKTDSLLRGNVGAELKAMQDAMHGLTVYFVPAYPEHGRTTKKGVHYVNNVPVAQTSLGSDPFSPVETSYIPDLMKLQGAANTQIICDGHIPAEAAGQILIFDASDNKEIQYISRKLEGEPLLMAGCGGFAGAVIEKLNNVLKAPHESNLPEHIVVLSGSITAISGEQLRTLEKRNYPNLFFEDSALRQPGYHSTSECAKRLNAAFNQFLQSKVLLCGVAHRNPGTLPADILSADRACVSENLGMIGKKLLMLAEKAVFIIIGGDTLSSVLLNAGIDSLNPLYEMLPGCVLCTASMDGTDRYFITKSGGFGDKDTLAKLIDKIGEA